MYPFVPNKSFGQLLYILPKTFTFLKTFISEISFIEVWFADQNSKPLETEDKVNITLVVNESAKYEKLMRYLVQPTDGIFVNSYRFLCFAKNMGENISKNIYK